MEAKERLQYVIDNEGLNPKVFSEKLGNDRPQSIYDVLKKKTKSISDSLANKIISVFPHYSKVWLLTGEGEILKNTDTMSIKSVRGNANIGNGTNTINNGGDEYGVKELVNQLKVKDEQIFKSQEQISKSQDQISKSQEQISKSQEQIDRLLRLLERQ